MANELKPCPFCGGKVSAIPFIYKLAELPKPVKLFGGWSLIKMRYREIPCKYVAECDDYCDGFLTDSFVAFGDTKQEAIEAWNRRADK